MSRKNGWLLFAVFILGLIFSCSKDDSSGPDGGQVPELQFDRITVPQGMQNAAANDPMVWQAMNYIEMANGVTGYASFFSPPGTAALGKAMDPGDTWDETWTSPDGKLTINLKARETSTMFIWEVYLRGTMDGTPLSNFKYIEANMLTDGSAGDMKVYCPESGDVLFEWEWEIGDTHDVSYIIEDGAFRIDISANPDGSGSMEHYESGEKIFEITWTAAGTGQWWTYDGGVIMDTDVF